jgi:hypothetical protein
MGKLVRFCHTVFRYALQKRIRESMTYGGDAISTCHIWIYKKSNEIKHLVPLGNFLPLKTV